MFFDESQTNYFCPAMLNGKLGSDLLRAQSMERTFCHVFIARSRTSEFLFNGFINQRTRRNKFFISFHWRPFVVIGSIVDEQLLFLPIEECLFLGS